MSLVAWHCTHLSSRYHWAGKDLDAPPTGDEGAESGDTNDVATGGVIASTRKNRRMGKHRQLLYELIVLSN